MVINAYRFILGREPENDMHVATWMSCGGVNELIEGFLAGPEFNSLSPERQRLAMEWIHAGMITATDRRYAGPGSHGRPNAVLAESPSSRSLSATTH